MRAHRTIPDPGGILRAGMLACLLAAAPAPGRAAGTQVASLDALSPLATQQEVARRLLSPVQREQFERAAVRRGASLRAHALSPGSESFELFVPPSADRTRLGLLVFIPPTDAFTVPGNWQGELARRGLVLIAPRNAGNGQDMLERRVPLALHAYGYASRHYAIDPERVYVGGFSGGARTAQLVAFGYADVFRGVLQIAGSDPFGETAVPPPPEPLMELARTRLRIVHATGTADATNIALDARTRHSLAALCVANVTQVDQPRLGHGLPERRGFARALDALAAPAAAEPRDGACRARLQARIDADTRAVEHLLGDGQAARARARLHRLDQDYGWLAAPRSNALARRLFTMPDGSVP